MVAAGITGPACRPGGGTWETWGLGGLGALGVLGALVALGAAPADPEVGAGLGDP